MTNRFKEILKGKVVLVGIGNILRGDDGFGPALIERLKGKVRAVCLDASVTPENYVARIADENPDTVLLVDAVSLQQQPGEYELIGSSDIVQSGMTTHDISLRMFIEYLKGQTQANIYMLGVQPKNISIGDEISPPVQETLEVVEQILKEVLGA
ncbi:MAG: hydrogenase 3 maturation endopeptidase HyCI [Candidatus Omnitrophota bacterium]